jgi:hypothetical protein
MADPIFELIGQLAWPAVVLFIFLVFRRQVAGLFDRVSKVKMQEFEMELREKIASLAVQTDQLERVPEITKQTNGAGLIAEREANLAQSQPVRAIMAKWEEVESALYDRVSKENTDWRGVLAATNSLFSTKQLSAEEVRLFNRLYEIRNIVAHEAPDKAVSAGYALEFLRTANILLDKLRLPFAKSNS